MSILNIGESMRRIIPDKPADQFGKDITGANNPVRNRTIALEGEDNSVDKKKSSVLRSVLSKIVKKKAKK